MHEIATNEWYLLEDILLHPWDTVKEEECEDARNGAHATGKNATVSID